MNMVWHPVELHVENLALVIDVTEFKSRSIRKKEMLKKAKAGYIPRTPFLVFKHQWRQ